jgi:hypothetical protein
VVPNAAPQRAFGGDQHRVRIDLEGGDAEPFQMRGPCRLIGEVTVGMLGEPSDHRAGQRALAHIGERRVIDDVIAMAGTQQAKEVEAALGWGGGEGREVGIADLGAEAIMRLVARAGVVHRDPGRARKGGAQHLARFPVKAVVVGGQQADQLALRDVDAKAAQQRQQPRHRGLSLMILGEHETAQLRPEMAIKALRQRRRYDLAVHGQPALALKVNDVRMHYQLLNHKAGVALETRAGRSRSQLDFAFLIDCQLRSRAAAPAPLLARRLRIGRLLHAARLAVRLDIRPTRTTLKPRDLIALRRNRSAQIGNLLQQLHYQQLQLAGRKTVNVLGQRHTRRESDSRRLENLIIVPLPRLLPLLRESLVMH